MINHEFQFIFTKIGKTASSSVEHALTDLPGSEDFGHWHILDSISNRTQGYFKFAFLRNPWDRCVSRYFYVKAKNTPREKHYQSTTFDDFIINTDNKFRLSADWLEHSPTLKSLIASRYSCAHYNKPWVKSDGYTLALQVPKLRV